MGGWSSWLREHPIVAAVAIITGGIVGLSALSLLIVPIFVLLEANALLGFFAFFVLLFMTFIGVYQLRTDDSDPSDTTVDPVTELEERYVRGELSDEEFEHRLDKIVETETEIERLTESESTVTQRSREVDTETT